VRATFAILLSSLLVWVQAVALTIPSNVPGRAPCKCCPCSAGQCCPTQRTADPRPATPLTRAAVRTDATAQSPRPWLEVARVQPRSLSLNSQVRQAEEPPATVPRFVRHCALLL